MRISELAKKADVSVRTIRYYIEEGLLPQPELKGPQTEYGSEYLVRLRLIQELKKAFLPLSEIRERIEQLSEDEIWQLLREAAENDELDVRVMSSQMVDPDMLRDDVIVRDLSRGTYGSPPASLESPSRPWKLGPDPEERQEEDGPNRAKEYIQKILRDRVEEPAPAPPSQPRRRRPESERWERYDLADGIELNVRGPLDARRESMLRRLLRTLRQELRGW